MDLIDRESVFRIIEKYGTIDARFRDYNSVAGCIAAGVSQLSAVDAVPVRRGRWIPHITEDGYKAGYDCSVCGVWLVMPNGLRKYCCDCGALMDGGETE